MGTSERPSLPSSTEIAVIGAGPHGLAAVAHLRAAGRDVHAFGRPMEFWECNMPAGMFLRSSHRSSCISDPHRNLTLDAFERTHGLAREVPIPIARFIDYGCWFQGNVLPTPDPRRVSQVEAAGGGFTLTLEDGSSVDAERVVVAAGIAPFAVRPAEFAHLPPGNVSHTSDHSNLAWFAGRHVLVVGAGQSALETAALLHEAGALTEVVARAPAFRWIPPDPGAPVRELTTIRGRLQRGLWQIQYPPHDVGPFPWNWAVASPDVWPLVPRSLQPGLSERVNFARGSAWLPLRLEGVPLLPSTRVICAVEAAGQVDVQLSDGSHRLVDHIMLGTGFKIDVSKYGFLGPELLRQLRLRDGYPHLSHGMESSVPRLHFLGAPAAMSFGPSMRFVTGSAYGARTLTRRVLRQRRALFDVAW